MSILSVTEKPAKAGMTDDEGSYEYTRVFHVLSDSPDEDVQTVLLASGLPAIGNVHPNDDRARCRRRRPSQQDDNRALWEVECEYSSRQTSVASSRATRPWNRKPRLSWSKYTSREDALTKDRSGTTIRNSAGDRFNPPLKWERHYPVLKITRYERTFSIYRIISYLDHVNSVALTICGISVGAGQALMTNVEGTQVEIDGVECWEVSYEIQFAEDWKVEFLDQGFYYWTGGTKGSGIKAQVLDGENEPSKTPELLNGVGGILGWAGTPHYLTFSVYETKDFRPLGLQ